MYLDRPSNPDTQPFPLYFSAHLHTSLFKGSRFPKPCVGCSIHLGATFLEKLHYEKGRDDRKVITP